MKNILAKEFRDIASGLHSVSSFAATVAKLFPKLQPLLQFPQFTR